MNIPDVSAAPARLSPEEVAAMSDEELSARVALLIGRVARATEIRDCTTSADFATGGSGITYFVKYGCLAGEFSPSNPVAVEHVREHMRERWIRDPDFRAWKMCSGVSGWTVEVTGFAPVPFITRGTLGRAVFECALLAAQEMQPPVSQATTAPEPATQDEG